MKTKERMRIVGNDAAAAESIDSDSNSMVAAAADVAVAFATNPSGSFDSWCSNRSTVVERADSRLQPLPFPRVLKTKTH